MHGEAETKASSDLVSRSKLCTIHPVALDDDALPIDAKFKNSAPESWTDGDHSVGCVKGALNTRSESGELSEMVYVAAENDCDERRAEIATKKMGCYDIRICPGRNYGLKREDSPQSREISA
jgi:hypothetical protein